MLALWCENNEFELRTDTPKPGPKAGEALIRVRTSGICSTDIELLNGYYPFVGIPGHEFVGYVEQAPQSSHWMGKRVVADITIACGRCRNCLERRKKHCQNRQVLGLIKRNGTFAQYVTIPCANLIPVPDGLSDEIAVFAEPLAAAMQFQDQISIHPFDRVLVVGAGRLGQLVARSLALRGCQLTVAARHPRQRKLLDEAGVSWIDPAKVPAREFDLVIEASGHPNGLVAACAAVRAGGALVLKSTYRQPAVLDVSSLVVNEVKLLGSRCGSLEKALKVLADGLIDPRPLIDGVYPLSQAPQAIKAAGEPGCMKILVDCSEVGPKIINGPASR